LAAIELRGFTCRIAKRSKRWTGCSDQAIFTCRSS
jgi:hypothetical protein